jgi:hypothetical protein
MWKPKTAAIMQDTVSRVSTAQLTGHCQPCEHSTAQLTFILQANFGFDWSVRVTQEIKENGLK